MWQKQTGQRQSLKWKSVLKVDTAKQRMWNRVRQRDDGVDKVNKLFHHEVCEIAAKFFLVPCFATVEDISGNLMATITQRTLNLRPLFGYK